MGFGKEKCAMLIMESEKQRNNGRILIIIIKKKSIHSEKSKHLEILEADTIKQRVMKEKIKKE